MTASRSDIERMIKNGVSQNATHLIVACDTYDYDNYPVYAFSDAECISEYKRIINQSMQSVDEVYDLRMDINSQLNERRARHLPKVTE